MASEITGCNHEACVISQSRARKLSLAGTVQLNTQQYKQKGMIVTTLTANTDREENPAELH